MSVLTRIPPPVSLADHAFATLKREILACRLLPGAAVSETLVTDRFQLGRAPVRAALARLAEEGLVHAVPRRGWVVSVVTVRDIHEVFALRLMLEPEAAALAAGQADLARLQALDDICAHGHHPQDPDTALDFLAANRGFHVAVAEMAGNQRLARQIGRLLDEATRMLVLGLSTRDRSGEMAHEHHALVAALGAHDAPRARQLMHDQVAASRDMVLAALTGPRSTLVVSDMS